MNIPTLIGLAAATLTTISFLPQAIKTIKTKETKGISIGMYSIFTTGILLWLIYGITVKDLPLIIANAITLIFTTTILLLVLKNKKDHLI